MSDIPTDDELVGERPRHDYLVSKTIEVMVSAPSAAEARSTAEVIFQLTPNNKLITTTVNVEKVRK